MKSISYNFIEKDKDLLRSFLSPSNLSFFPLPRDFLDFWNYARGEWFIGHKRIGARSLWEVEWCLINFNFVPYIHVSWEMSISACIEYSSCSLWCWCLDGFNQRALLVLFCTRQPRYPQGSLGILKALKNFIPSPFLRYRVSQQNLTNQSTVFEYHPKCRIWVFVFWHFSPVFV